MSKLVPITAARLVTAAVPKTHVTRPRPAKSVVTKPHSPPRWNINRSPSRKASTFPLKVTAAKAPKGGKIFGKGKIKTGKLDFADVYFVKELKFNLFSVTHMCDKKNSVLFTDIECLVLSPEFKLPDENQVLLKVSRENNMYNAEAISTSCYVQHMVFVTIPQNKTRYELLLGRIPSIGFMRPFGCPVTILNTLDPLGKFDGKVDEGCLVGYSPNVASNGPTWLFDIDTLTKTMNYQPVTTGNQSNSSAGVQKQFDTGKVGEDNVQQYVLFPVCSSGSTNPQNTDDDAAFGGKKPEFEGRKPESEVYVSLSSSAQTKKHDNKTKREAKGKSPVQSSTRYRNLSAEFEDLFDNSINEVNAADSPIYVVGQISTNSTNTFSAAGPSNTAVNPTHGKSSYMNTSQYLDDPNMPELEDITYFDDEEDVGVEVDFTNLETTITVSPIPTTRVHKDHHVTQIIGDLSSATKTRSMTRVTKDQGHTQEEGIDYEEVFTPVTRIEAIRGICLSTSNPDYPDKVYNVVKALYGLHQAPRAWQKGDILLVQIYVDNIIFGSTNKYLCNAFEKLIKDKFQMSSMGELTFFLGLQVKQKPDGIFISQDKYVDEILRKFGLTDGKLASTPIDTEKPLLKDPDGEDVDVHTYRSMIGSLMYLTSSRPDIMFAAYSESDYAGACLDRKSTTGGCQFLGCRLISWQCKKQTVMATSSTEAEYVAAASCCAQVLWIQNQLLDYGWDLDNVTWGGQVEAIGTVPVCCRCTGKVNGGGLVLVGKTGTDQTVSGKDSSNPLMVDNLPKSVWYSTHHVALMKSWLVQKQTALGQTTTGKENSNPFMDGVNIPRCDEDRLEVMELMVFLLRS
nr:hypothetical protein [Tanacetum cinerariifolium]